jgi:hypothetical protein
MLSLGITSKEVIQNAESVWCSKMFTAALFKATKKSMSKQ